MGRRNGTAASKEVVTEVFMELHAMHFTPAVIGKLTSYSDQYVRKMLDEKGLRQRWNEAGDCMAALPGNLVDRCLKLRDKR